MAVTGCHLSVHLAIGQVTTVTRASREISADESPERSKLHDTRNCVHMRASRDSRSEKPSGRDFEVLGSRRPRVKA